MDGKILLLPGDGIGFEVTEQALKILTAIQMKAIFGENRTFNLQVQMN